MAHKIRQRSLLLTNDKVKNLTPTEESVLYYDTQQIGLSVIVRKTGRKSFSIRRRDRNKRDKRILIGDFPDVTVSQARSRAMEAITVIRNSKNLYLSTLDNKTTSQRTFQEIFTEFLNRYAKEEKDSWSHDEAEINKHAKHWFHRKAASITKQEVIELHDKIGKNSGRTHANRVIQRISAIYNKAIYWERLQFNPAKGIKKFKEESRDRFLETNEIPRFFDALTKEHNQTVKDFVMVALLTGVRKTNILKIKWSDVNLDANIPKLQLHLENKTKPGRNQDIALVEDVIKILRFRKKLQERSKIKSDYVFHGKGEGGYYKDPKKGWARILENAKIEDLTIHDIRRTLATYLNQTESNPFIISAILGHQNKNVTETYARSSLEAQRDSIGRAWSKIKEYTEKQDFWWE
ncbi:MAG: tyrosine-type recombinase/integrase [Alphaproteobacteria bacterium]|jgi:integrase|nr:tyrosine-type recombinase/integrase [Alphaproteobacteria bacterium]